MLLFLSYAITMALVQGQDNGNVFKPDPLTPGPWVHMTHGQIWPRPAQQQTQPDFFVLDPKSFKIQVSINFIIIIIIKFIISYVAYGGVESMCNSPKVLGKVLLQSISRPIKFKGQQIILSRLDLQSIL